MEVRTQQNSPQAKFQGTICHYLPGITEGTNQLADVVIKGVKVLPDLIP